MSEWLTVERSINRDNQGNCLPEVIEVLGITLDDESHPKIKVDPLTRSEFLQLSKGGETGKLEDIEIIKQHCLQPKYVDADFDRMSLRSINALVFAIIEASTGIPQAQLRETRVSMIASAQEELLKKKQSLSS